MHLYKDWQKMFILGIFYVSVVMLIPRTKDVSLTGLEGSGFNYSSLMRVERNLENLIGVCEPDGSSTSGAIKEVSYVEEKVELLPIETNSGAISELEVEVYDGYSSDDVDVLTRVTMAEAESESLEGKIAIVNVVLNRQRETGDSIRDIVFAPNQFCTNWRYNLEPNEECKEAVRLALEEGKKSVDDDVLFFCASYVDFENYNQVASIGGHKFYTR